MEGEWLNAVNYIKNISKKKVTSTKIEAFMGKKELFTCKEDLDNTIDSFIEDGLIQIREEIFVFRKICRALFSWNTRFEIRLFVLYRTSSRPS